MKNQIVFDYYPPIGSYIGLVSIPHSGLEVPSELEPFLTDEITAIRQDVDFETKSLVDIEQLQKNGVGVLVAHIVRTCIDLNRDRENSLLHWKKNTKGNLVVLKEPSKSKSEELLTKYYDPYYEQLTESIELLKKEQERAAIIDLHSMPSKATEFHLNYNPNQEIERPDFCLSDLRGQSCRGQFIKRAQELIGEKYDRVNVNNPYFGGFLTQYINTIPNVENIQIEISRALYMDEEKFEMLSNYKELASFLTNKLIELFHFNNSPE